MRLTSMLGGRINRLPRQVHGRLLEYEWIVARMTEARISIERAFELVLAALIAASLCGLLFAAIGIFKAPQSLLVGLAGALIYGFLTPGQAGAARSCSGASGWHVLLLLLVALFFRLPPSNYVSGGQDQGVYVNIAAHIVHSGGIAVEDRVRGRLGESPAAKIYDRDNAAVGGDFLLGIFQRGEGAGKALQFQFYHLFPVIMALAGGAAGLDASAYALTALSLFSVLLFYCLALELTQRPRVALGSALLLALNPLHAFFSRFPVSEVPTLCFTLGASWLLLRMWRNRDDRELARQRWGWVVLSAAALGCAFLTRISGFMYIPVVFLIAGVAYLSEMDRQARRAFFLWMLLVNGLFAVSVFYGYAYSPIYTEFHLAFAFGKYFGPQWALWIISLWALGLLGLTALYLASPESRIAQMFRRLLSLGDRWLGTLVALALAAGLYKLYQLGWTERYASDPWLAQRWHIAKTGSGVFGFSSVVVAAEYVSPFLFALFVALAWKRNLPGALRILLAFVLMFHLYLIGPQWLIPYQPYYARYLVSEYVPYLILFVASAIPFIASRAYRTTAAATLVLGGTYCAALSVGQLRANEHHGMAQSYQQVVSHVGNEDLLLLDTETLPLPYQLIEMPFLLRYDRHVARITQASLTDAHYLNDLQAGFDSLFLLSGKAVPPEGFQPVDAVRFREWVAEQGNHPPLRSDLRFHGRTYLYTRPIAAMLPGGWIPLAASGLPMAGWSSPEAWGIWSDGYESHIDVPVAVRGSQSSVLELAMKPFVTATHPRQRTTISVDGKPLSELVLVAPATISIPLGDAQQSQTGPHRVRFNFPDAVTPRQAGMVSADTRRLAIGVTSVRVVSDDAAVPVGRGSTSESPSEERR